MVERLFDYGPCRPSRTSPHAVPCCGPSSPWSRWVLATALAFGGLAMPFAQAVEGKIGSVAAQEQKAADPTDIETHAMVAASVMASGRAARRQVMQDLDAYLAEIGLREGPQIRNGSRVTVLKEIMATTVRPGDRGFHTARRTAYQQAYLSAIGKFISQRGQVIENSLSNVIRDNPENLRVLQELCRPSQGEILTLKTLALANAIIDQALVRLDASPVDVSQGGPNYSCPAAERLFRSVTSRRAAESIVGLRVLFTSELNGYVGVVLAHSDRYEEAAAMLASGRGTRAPEADPLGELRATLGTTLDSQALQYTFGTRILGAANGEPVIVAFAQASPDIGPADSQRTIDRKFENARRAAHNEAAAELARFARVNAFFASENETFDESGKYVDLDTGAADEPALVAERLFEETSTRSRLQVQGLAEVHSWELDEDVNGVSLVGVVLAWSPSLQSTFGRDAAPPQTAPAREAASGQGSGVHRGQSPRFLEDW
jgi:hypothetical protein